MNVEFVSVNPTGPLHVGHARYAVLRRRALPHPRLRRSRRDARVLRQRLRHADGALRPVARRPLRAAARPRHAGARGGLPGRLPARPRRRAHRRGRRPLQGRARGGRPGRHGPAGGGRRRAQALGPGRASWPSSASRWSACASRSTCGRRRARSTRATATHRGFGGEVGKSLADLDGEGLLYDEEGAVVAHDDPVRRRQGPGPHPPDRRAHLLPQRHRLSPRQDGPRLRAHDRHLGRRPPRLRAAHEGRLHGAAAARPGQAGAHHRPAREPAGERGGAADEQAPGRHRHRGRPHRRDRRGRGAVPARRALARHHARPGHRPRRAADQPEPRVLRAVRARAHLQHPAQPAGRRGAAGRAKPSRP